MSIDLMGCGTLGYNEEMHLYKGQSPRKVTMRPELIKAVLGKEDKSYIMGDGSNWEMLCIIKDLYIKPIEIKLIKLWSPWKVDKYN